MLEFVTVFADLLHPAAVVDSFLVGIGNPHRSNGCGAVSFIALDFERAIFGPGLRVAGNLYNERSPLHKFDDVFDVYVVGLQLLDVAKQVFRQGPAIGVAACAALRP